MKKRSLVLILGLLALTPPIFSRADWQALKTRHFTVFYKPGYETQAYDVLRNLEFYRPAVESLTGNQAYNLPVVIEDIGTVSNGYADPVFYNIHLFTYPPDGGQLGFTENWWRLVGVHEYSHILHLTNTRGIPGLLTRLGGGLFQPNLCSPGWIVEGITVYSESQRSRYEGRLNDGYFDAYIRIRAAANRFPSILEAAYTPSQFPGRTGIYLYGGEFFNYLAEEYGPDKFAQFFNSYGSSVLSYLSPIFPFFGLDRAARKVYGKPFSRLWKDWQKYELERYEGFIPDYERVTQYGWIVVNPLIYEDKLYYMRSYPVKTGALESFQFNKIIERDLKTQRERVLVRTTSPFSAPIRVDKGRLYYSTLELKPGYANATNLGFGLYSMIREKDLTTGKDRVMIGDEMRAFSILPDGQIIYSRDRSVPFGSELWVYNPANKEKRSVLNTDYLIGEIVFYNEKLIVSAREDWQNFSIYLMDLETGKFQPLIHTPCFEGGIEIYGDRLFFTANYEKIYSVYCYDLLSGKIYRLTDGGFALTGAYDEQEGELYFVGLNPDGQDIYRVPGRFGQFQIPDYPPSTPPDLSSTEVEIVRGNYFDNLKTLIPKIHLPIFTYSDLEGAEVGLILLGQDAVAEFQYWALGSYNFRKKAPSLDLSLASRLFVPLISNIGFDYEEPSLRLGLQYPFIYRLSPGISKLWIGLDYDLYRERFSRRELEPSVGVETQSPRRRTTLMLTLPFERTLFGSEIDRTGLYANLSLVQYIPGSQLSLDINGVHDPGNPDPAFPKIRGYPQPLDARVGAQFTLEYSRPILRIRKGPWNPNLFFEDLCINLFLDSAISKVDTQLSTGLELFLETGCLFWLKAAPGIGLAMNRDGEYTVYFTMAAGGI